VACHRKNYVTMTEFYKYWMINSSIRGKKFVWAGYTNKINIFWHDNFKCSCIFFWLIILF
jgi:hypothetical protein